MKRLALPAALVLGAAIGYGTSELKEGATSIPTTPESGEFSKIPATVSNIRLQLEVNGQRVEVNLGDQPTYRCLPKEDEQ